MKERPINFNDEMVRAILSGVKTQTRRPLKVQPPNDGRKWQTATLCDTTCREDRRHIGKYYFVVMDGLNKVASQDKYFRSKYGYVGDHLWVRENFSVQPELWDSDHAPQPIHYMTDITDKRMIEDYVCKPCIHMPRWASRITLEIKNVRVERLWDISSDDVLAEGVKCLPREGTISLASNTRSRFAQLWNTIYSEGSFEKENPWVWVIEFRRIK